MAVLPLRQTHSFRPVVRLILIDLVCLLRDARNVFLGLLHFFGEWVVDVPPHDVWDAQLGAGGVHAGATAFSEQIFDWRW